MDQYICTRKHKEEDDTERGIERGIARESETQSFNHLSVHLWVRSAIHASQQFTFPVGFLSLKLPRPPCAVL